jgi:hypothetical protein
MDQFYESLNSQFFNIAKQYTLGMAIIYRIRDKDTKQTYIGCTTLPLDVRLYNHQKQPGMTKAWQIIERKNYDVEVLETCEDCIKYAREVHYIMSEPQDLVVNKMGKRPEIKSDRVGKRPQKYAQRKIEAENMQEYHHKYKTEICKAQTQEYNVEYYEKNRERLTAKVDCPDCGGRYCQLTKSMHLKTKKHQVALALKAEMEACVVQIQPN